MTMTPRERVLAAIRHEPPDRTPCDFWAEPPALNRLFAHLGYSDKDRLLDDLGVDMRHLEAPAPPEREIGAGVFQNFWGERFVHQPTAWGPMRHDVKGALANARSLSDLESFAWPAPDCIDQSGLKALCRRYDQHAVLYGFADVWQRPALVRGWEEFFIDLVERPDWVHFLCRKFTDFYLEDYTRAAEATNGRIDLYLLISDLGSQHGPLISTGMFREFAEPYLKEMIDHIHRLGARVLFHSCGDIGPLIPELIRLGVDVLDPIQPVGPTMYPETLKRAFGGRLCFHGGIDMQQLLPCGTPAQVQAEVRHCCEVLGAGGGYILAPAHLFQPDVPPENILAFYQAQGPSIESNIASAPSSNSGRANATAPRINLP
jgi:uroporphyrinogen decarboxylase